MKLLYIGNITGPFGIKGEVKVLSETNHKNEIFKVGNNLYIDNKKYIIESVKQNPKCEIIKFLGGDDISQTDDILNKEVYVNKNELSIIDSIRFMLPYSAVTAFTFVALIILWYLINIPLGVNGFVFI